MKPTLRLVLLLTAPLAAWGQMPSEMLIPGGPVTPFAGAPFSAERVVTRTQTLADGTHIESPPETTRIYRDSAGRIRTEITPVVAGHARPEDVFITISDAFAGIVYALDPKTKTARRRVAAARSGAPVVAPTVIPPRPESEHPRTKTESLGARTIEGLTVEGRRATTTWPVGSQGNDREIVTVTEIWSSSDLKMTLLNKTIDPRAGEITVKVQNIIRAEPDAALFMPPADYAILEQP